ncbi:hypothetical protein PV664_35830 [Streptomyces sp. ME01-18a]|uniref:hypothetical protein n=1 Tax=Streptomyces sp. ME01-18a TaxID=3028669 RepID=UPI0029B392E6|nr:hypothetical protein [Streptomyces sp. ME01-18a]MDX3434225.1 hypothetical protein [Streptomyces sp. ME01-18a]
MPGYNKRLRKAGGLLQHITRLLAINTTLWSDGVWGGGLHAVGVRLLREAVKRSDRAGWAEYGYCTSHSRFFCGRLRLHLGSQGRSTAATDASMSSGELVLGDVVLPGGSVFGHGAVDDIDQMAHAPGPAGSLGRLVAGQECSRTWVKSLLDDDVV